ncbi:MAG: hypothetical protein EP343_02375 [Deltaproteobacteria bacterium]|nr:MAG: hypothetical protein EP343_02375 [Deltaproteobacteria bacterium]
MKKQHTSHTSLFFGWKSLLGLFVVLLFWGCNVGPELEPADTPTQSNFSTVQSELRGRQSKKAHCRNAKKESLKEKLKALKKKIQAFKKKLKAKAKPQKVEVCHLDKDTATYKVIKISEKAKDKHLRHGDKAPGEYWADKDGDGYGDANGTTDRCPNPGFVSNKSDCDDSDANRSPGSSESCSDNIDNNCNGQVNEGCLSTQVLGGDDQEEAYSALRDSNGNTYVAGFFNGNLRIGTYTVVVKRRSNDAYVAKLGPSGSVQWVATATGDYDDVAQSLAFDQSGNILVAGRFENAISFGSSTLKSSGYGKFLARLSPGGKWLGATGVSGTNVHGTYSNTLVASDSKGNTYLLGSFGQSSQGSVSFVDSKNQTHRFYYDNNQIRVSVSGGAATVVTTAGNESLFLAKWNTSGQWEWTRFGSGYGRVTPTGITVDGSDVYTSAEIESLDSGKYAMGSCSFVGWGGNAALITKWDGTGSCLWNSAAGGTRVNAGAWGVAVANGVVHTAVGYTNYEYLIDTVHFGSHSLTTASGGASAGALVTLDAKTGTFTQATEACTDCAPRNLGVDGKGNLYMLGQLASYWGDLKAGSFTASSQGNFDLFVLKANSAGKVTRVDAGGGLGNEFARGLLVEPNGAVLVPSNLQESGVFNGQTYTTPNYSIDILLWALQP